VSSIEWRKHKWDIFAWIPWNCPSFIFNNFLFSIFIFIGYYYCQFIQMIFPHSWYSGKAGLDKIFFTFNIKILNIENENVVQFQVMFFKSHFCTSYWTWSSVLGTSKSEKLLRIARYNIELCPIVCPSLNYSSNINQRLFPLIKIIFPIENLVQNHGPNPTIFSLDQWFI